MLSCCAVRFLARRLYKSAKMAETRCDCCDGPHPTDQRQRSAISCTECVGWPRSHCVCFLDFATFSAPCGYPVVCLQRLADVHSSGAVLRLIKVVMALGATQCMCSMKPCQLGAVTERVACDLDVTALSTSRSIRFVPNIRCLCVSVPPWYDVMAWLCSVSCLRYNGSK